MKSTNLASGSASGHCKKQPSNYGSAGRFLTMIELWRRLSFLLCVCGAVLLAFAASLSPVVLVTHVDFSRDQSREGSYMGVRIATEESKRLRGLHRDAYIAEKTRGQLVTVNGQRWQEVFDATTAVAQSEAVAERWQRRLPADQYPTKALFFKPEEPPINSISDHFVKNHDTVYLSRAEGTRMQYLKAECRFYDDEDFQLGSGFTNRPTPPASMLFPYRRYSLWLLFCGFLLYLLLPSRQKHPESIRYPRWRMVLGDTVALILSVPFFAFPFLITGGTLQAFTQGWPLFFFFWPIFFLGLWLWSISAWFASFALIIGQDRLVLSTYKGVGEFLYRDMAYFQPVVFKPPKWLIVASWLAALSGKGSAGIGAAGRAMILSSSAWGSIGIRMRDGSDVFINITDQMGSNALKGFEAILEKMRDNGVEEKGEVRQIRSMGLETMRR